MQKGKQLYNGYPFNRVYPASLMRSVRMLSHLRAFAFSHYISVQVKESARSVGERGWSPTNDTLIHGLRVGVRCVMWASCAHQCIVCIEQEHHLTLMEYAAVSQFALELGAGDGGAGGIEVLLIAFNQKSAGRWQWLVPFGMKRQEVRVSHLIASLSLNYYDW